MMFPSCALRVEPERSYSHSIERLGIPAVTNVTPLVACVTRHLLSCACGRLEVKARGQEGGGYISAGEQQEWPMVQRGVQGKIGNPRELRRASGATVPPALRRRVHYLGQLLGRVLREQLG